MRILLALLALSLLSACPPEPFYDDDIGVPGVATDEGALAGSWAQRQRYIYVTFIPLIGSEVESGGDQYFLIERSWDAEARQYDESWTFCIDDNMEAAGLYMETPEATLNSVVFEDTVPEVDHGTGEVKIADALELWALRNMPDPYHTAIPTPDNYQDAPMRDWIYDADGDGNIGCTMNLRGALEGEDYYINRKVTGYRGVVASEDQIVGLLNQRSSWSVLESTLAVAVHTGEIPSDDGKQHPDPKRSWYQQVRLPEGSTCADVKQAREDETLSKLRPF